MITRPNFRFLLTLSVILGFVALGLFWLTRPTSQAPVATTTPTPTVQPELPEEDRALVERLSRELAAKFYTYTQPDSPAYLQSIKPYLDDAFFAATKAELARYQGRLTQAGASSAQAGEVNFKKETTDAATVTVRVTISAKRGTSEENPEIQWRKSDDRWTAEYILTETSQQNKEKYVN